MTAARQRAVAALLPLVISCATVRNPAPGLAPSPAPFCLEQRWHAICLPEPYPC